MKAIRINGYKQPPQLQQVAVPQPAPGEVLVRVQAAALNPLDVHLVSGAATRFFQIAFPFTPASDFSGIVERVGEGVSQWRPGDAVIAWADPLASGGLAEFALVPATSCVALPPGFSAAQGAGIPTAASTAWHALFSAAGLRADETVLIQGGAGGVGSFAVQFARKAGARVIATASGDGLELARRLGASQVIDYRALDFKGAASEVDVVLDLVGGQTQAHSLAVLRRGGRLVSTVMRPDEATAQARGISASLLLVKLYSDRLREVVAAIAAQSVEVVIDRVAPLAEFDQAWARQASGRSRGKVIVSIA